MHNDIRLFEKICLEGFQAGLSWLTILRKRENFRAGFDGFDFTITSLNTDYIHGIRGPPIVQAEAVFHPLSIILTTQRFRL
jgi:hypothetical protein